MNLKGCCNCGKPIRYAHFKDSETVGSCNKYGVCPTYEELEYESAASPRIDSAKYMPTEPLSKHPSRHLLKTHRSLTMSTNKPLFRFNAQVVESDTSDCYITRWDNAISVSVIAPSCDEAIKKVRAMIGSPTRYNVWAVKIVAAEEIVDVQ